jgi:diaminopimelate decarboxylase
LHYFDYKSDRLYAEDVDLSALADEIGAPFYVYSEATLRRHFQVFRDAFAGLDALVAYSVKANSNLAVIKTLAGEGAGADVVSGGELSRALKAGVAPEKIVFSGVGKTREEIARGIEAGIYQFNVESEPEFDAIADIARAKNTVAPIAIRINPDVAAGGHDKISTGKAEDKFGVPPDQARALYAKAAKAPSIEVKGLAVHIGSQVSDLRPFEAAFRKVAKLIEDLRSAGASIERLDVGGGLAIPYGDNATPPHPDAYAAMVRKVTDGLGLRLILEPGRMIAGNAGVLVSRVIYVKEGASRRFLILDAAMNDLIRPALYGAYHDIWPVRRKKSARQVVYDVVGPVCETGDRFATARVLPELQSGDLVALMSAGAYGAVQASQYNTRPLAPEVLVNGARFAIVRKRPTFEEIIAGETIPDWLD